MSSRVCLVHYHEIGLKGRNRYAFERRLSDNLKAALVSFPIEDIVRISGYILVTFADENVTDAVAAAIAATPGVVRVSTGWRCGREFDELCAQAAIALFDSGPFDTFRVSSKRSNTDFPLTSLEVNVRVGAYLCELVPDKKVKLKNPDTEVHITIVQGSAYVYSRSIHGVGGLPVGSAGRVVSLLSAGIDSPVATWKMIRRGAVAICVHFSGRPQTSDASEHLVREIVEALQPAAGIARLYIVAFGDYQREISLTCPPELRVIMYRRLMFCVAERIAEIEHAGALVTGESLGQVASQTLANIRATDDVAELPVFRP
ncbi:MAG: tRNA 4-thiouridine(8) synthase ThiI, partial [Actinobacteria bacterium]|nr:tRNA 4-thiouridine(8) synthase ThiI [Actinomycetota bacterium]